MARSVHHRVSCGVDAVAGFHPLHGNLWKPHPKGELTRRWSLDFILYGIIIHQFILWVSNARTEPRFNQVIVVGGHMSSPQ